jgi:hypothetical protein
MSKPSKPSSIILARNIVAFSPENDPAFVRLAASKVITSMCRIDAISPTTRCALRASRQSQWDLIPVRGGE